MKWILIASLGAAVAFGAVVVGAKKVLPPRIRARIEELAGEVLGREVRIARAFEISYSLTPAVVAEEITLANEPWGSDPAMVRIDRARISLDLASLWNRPVRIASVEVSGVRILLETDEEGKGNWLLQRKPRPPPDRPPERPPGPPVVFDRASIRDFELVSRSPGALPLKLDISHLDARLDPGTGMVDLETGGSLNDVPWDLGGRVGTLDRLYELRDVDHELRGRIGDSKIAVRGRLRDPLSLGDPNVAIEIEGPDIAAALASFGLRSPVSGAFDLNGRISPTPDGVDLDLTATLSGAKAALRGKAGPFLRPGALDADVEVSGPDTSIPGGWIGLKGLPPGPFEVKGHVLRARSGYVIERANLHVGASSVGIEGVVGASASLSGTDLRVNAKGRDLSELSDLVRTRLPAGPYALKGRLRRLEDRLAFEDMVLHAGGLDVDGTCALAIPPRLDGLQATFRASGPDLSKLSVLAAVKLPEAPFAIEGRMAGRGMAIDLDGVKGRLGDSSFDLRGSLVPAARLLGSDLHVTITGADLRASAAQAGLGGQERIPADAFDLSGRVRVVSDGYEVEGIQAKVGRLSAEAGGRLGLRPLEDATSLDLHVQGPALSDLGRWGAPPGLPDDRFNARGRLRIIQGVERVDQVAVEIGDDRVEIYGALGPLSDLSATNAAVNVTGPRFTDLFRFAPAAGVEIPSLEPMGPYSFSGRVLKAPAALELQEAILRVENAEIRIDGLIGTGARFRGTDIHVAARAPDASFAKLLAHRTLPEGPVEVRGGFKRDEESVLLDGLSLSIGDARAEVSGRIVPAPGSTSADLDVMVAGPHLDAILGPISGVSPLPPDPFELSARLSWTPGRISSSRLAARLGDSDLEGTMTIHREGRPVLEADLQSNRLAVSQLIAGFLNPSSSGGGPSEARSGRNALLFPDRPLRLEPLKSFDARIRLKASVTEIHGVPLNDVTLEAGVRDGVLSLDHAEGTGRSGGHATAMLRVEPRDAGYRLEASAGLAGGRLHLPKMKDAEEKAPSLDVEIEFEGEGRSLHQIAASSEGRALVALGPGKVPRSSEVFTSDILAGLLNALNPFSDAAPYTDFECGVLAAGMENGKAVVQPIAARSDKLTIVGRGRIDFETEEIDLVWTLKPRKGVGISAASIANPYVKLGGTLASPSLDAKPLEAAASTGAAVATAGLTILFKGLYDRITAEKKVCVNALEEAERREQERAARKKE